MDLHKDSLQMVIVDRKGRVESNSKIPNTFEDIDEFFSDISKSSGIVMESSSVSEEIFLHLRDSGFKVTVSLFEAPRAGLSHTGHRRVL